MDTAMNDTLADRDDKLALIMGTEGVSIEAACQALDECGGDVDRAMKWLGDTNEEAQQETFVDTNIIANPSHVRRHRKGDVDDSIDQPTQRHHSSFRSTPAPVASFQPRDDGYEEEGDKERGDAIRSASNVAKNPSPMVASRSGQPHPPAALGAIAVPGVDDVPPNSDEYTLTPQTEVPSTTPANPMEQPVITAHAVRATDHDLEVMQSQIQHQGKQLEQLRRKQENMAVGQVVDEEAQDNSPSTGGTKKGSGDESTPLMTPKRKWFVAAAALFWP